MEERECADNILNRYRLILRLSMGTKLTLGCWIFETQKVKQSTDKEKKSKLRSAQTPLELLVAYNEFDD